MTVYIPMKIKSLNKTNTMHWAARHREGKKWETAIWASLNGKILKASGRMLVTISSYRKKICDKDNIAGGAKMVVDALKRLGIIVDDTPAMVEVTYNQIQSKSEYTEISWSKEF